MSIIELVSYPKSDFGTAASDRIKSALWSSIQSEMLTDASCATLNKITASDTVFNLSLLTRSLRDSTTILVHRVLDSKPVFHVRLTVNTNHLKSFVIDRMRNSVHVLTQKRRPDQKPDLEFLDEINRSVENVTLSFSFNTEKNSVSNLVSLTSSHQKNNKWLNNLLTKSIISLNDSLFFAGDNDE